MERFDGGNKYFWRLQKMKIFLVLLVRKIPEYLIVFESENLVE